MKTVLFAPVKTMVFAVFALGAVAPLAAEPVTDYASLVAAIQAARAGDEIEVSGLIELEATISLTKAITVKGAPGRAADAVLRAAPGISAVSTTVSGAMFKDLTITGVSGKDTAASLKENSVLSGCVISNNTVTAAVVNGGLVSRCLLAENVCDRVFHGNSQDMLSGANNSLVVSNTFTTAIFYTAYNGMFIENNTVVDNRAASGTAKLFGRYAWGTTVVVNCIFWNNTFEDGSRMATAAGSTTASFSGFNRQKGDFTMNNNIEEFDPRLDGNFRPTRFSPGVDSGVLDFVWTDRERFHTLDFDGRARVLGGSMDRGAFEFDPSSLVPTVFHVSTVGSDETGDGSERAPFATLAKAASLAAFGDTIRLAAGTYEQTEEVVLSTGVRVEGVGAVVLSNRASASAVSRLVTLRNGAAVLSGVTLTGGTCTATASALVVSCGTVTNCVITGNTSSPVPVVSLGATPLTTLTHCAVSGNTGGGNGFAINSFGAQAAVRRSVISGNTLNKSYCGGSCYGVWLSDCEISDNIANAWSQEGSGARECILERCVITGNNGIAASALRDSRASDCLIVNNTSSPRTESSVAVLASTLYNCTVVGNTGLSPDGAFGVKGGTAYNSIVWGNTNLDGTVTNNVSGTALYFCCTDPSVAELTSCNKEGNVFDDPLLSDSYKLDAASPCVNAGSEDYRASETDLAGKDRVVAGTVNMGCYEKSLDDVFTATLTDFARDGDEMTLNGFVLAPDGVYSVSWDFGDGTVTAETELTVTGGGGAAVSAVHTYAAPRLYPVTLTLRGDGGRVSTTEPMMVVVRVAPGEIFVSPDGSDLNTGSASAPLKSADGARMLAADGVTIRFAPGEYDLDYEFADAVSLVGCGDRPEDVVIRKTTKSASRLVTLSDAAQTVRNLTLEGGSQTGNGGAVYLAAGTLRDCIVRNSTATGNGGGIYLENSDDARVVSCVVSNTTAKGNGFSVCGGGRKATVEKSVLRDGRLADGSPQYTYGGCYSVTLKDCVVADMKSPVWSHLGAGAYNCALYRCVVTGNDGWSGGALHGCTAYDCLIAENVSTYSRSYDENLPAVSSSTLYNCTVAGNKSLSSGSVGVSGGAAYNSIIVGNTSLDGSVTNNYADITLLHRCCTAPADEGDVNGNIFADPKLGKGFVPAADSPCVNAGISRDVVLQATYFPNGDLRACDLAGSSRVKGARSISAAMRSSRRDCA